MMRGLATSLAIGLIMPVVAHTQDGTRTAQVGSAPAQVTGSPFRQIVRAGDTLYVSGQIGIDPATDEVASGGISNEVRHTLERVRRLVESEGASMAHVVKCTVFLTNMSDFAAMNEAYRSFFPKDPPARTTVQVAALPDPRAHVEIDCIAVVPARRVSIGMPHGASR